MRRNLLLILFCLSLVACAPIQPEIQPPSAAGNTTFTTAPNADAPNANATGQPSEESSEATATLTPQAVLERLFSEPLQAEEWFTTEFLNQVPAEQVAELITQLTEQLGTIERIDGESSPFTLVFELGTVSAEISLDADGRIVGLFLGGVTLNVANVDEAVALISELPGETSVLITQNGEDVISLHADTPLGVGSAFKLAVLSTLRTQIEAGMHTWDEVVSLAAEWKAPPSSVLRNWPDGSPVTLHTLAIQMISVSDNTATDALIDIVGREEIEAITPHNRPLLTTHELFKLKSSVNADLLAAYQAGDETEKREVLEALATAPPPEAQDMSTMPILDVEWHFSARELCALMAQVEEIPLMTVSPGPAGSQADRWERIAFKGGSELGVLNLTTWLESADGDSYCVTMTQNNPDAAINEDEVTMLYRTLLSVLE